MNLTAHRFAAFAGMVAALGLLIAVFATFVGSYPGQERDHAAMLSVSNAFGHDVPSSGWLGAHQISMLVAAGLVLAGICAARRSLRLAVHAGVLVLTATAAAVGLKAALVRPGFGIGSVLNSFPSNTVAAFAAAAVAIAAVSPPRLRSTLGFLAVGGAVVVSGAVVALQWHRPADVVGGWLVAVAAAFATECLVPVWIPDRRGDDRRDTYGSDLRMRDWRRCDSY